MVDNDGNYLLGGHTTVGNGVVNWDYVALKVNSQTKQEMWRKTYGQPRGFDAQWIHDEMYGVALDKEGNYLLLGGSGDEYPYSADGSGEWQVVNIVSDMLKLLYLFRAGRVMSGAATWWLSPRTGRPSTRTSGATRAATTPGSGSAWTRTPGR